MFGSAGNSDPAKTAKSLQRKSAMFAKRPLEKFKLEGGMISRGKASGPIAGATARVETAGELRQRVTLTRVALTGLFALALKKKRDDRELYITVEGKGFELMLELNPTFGAQARQWAAEFNTLAMQAATNDRS